MAVGKITKRAVDAVAKPASGRAFLWDDTLKGFGLMVTHKGARSYILQYRIGGRGSPTRRATIGQHGNPWTAEQARDRAEELLGMVRRKIDPVVADKGRLAAERAAREDSSRFAFDAVADLYVASVKARKLRRADDVAAVFRRDLKPCFGAKPLPSIGRADIHDCLASIGARSRSSANVAHAWLRAMFGWAVDQARFGIIASPMFAMSPPFPTVKRKRVLSDAELRRILNAATALGGAFGALISLLAVTGQRLREVSGMSWGEVDLAQRLWRIPGERAKNGTDHLCPLSPQAVAILAAVQPDADARTGLVFAAAVGRRSAGDVQPRPISGFSSAKRRLDAILAKPAADGAEKPPITPWTLHDLRRTLATGLQSKGFPVEHVEAVLNHVSGKRGGIVAVYQTHEYLPEKTKALEAWGRHVEDIQNDGPKGSNVIALAERRA